MGVTIVGPPEITLPLEQVRPIIELKERWSDTKWILDPSLIPISADVTTANGGVGAMHMSREYGATKRVYDEDLGDSESIDIDRHWVRMRFSYQQGDEIAWMGRISTEIREFEGAHTKHDADEIPAGGQIWAAYGPLDYLRKISISQAWWWVEDEDQEEGGGLELLGILQPMNMRDRQGMLVGNRSEEKHGKAFMFGGTKQWSRKEFVEYILDRFVNINQGSGTNPTWTLGGQTKALEQIIDQIDFGSKVTVLDMLQELISPRIGLDFWVDFTDEGFEIVVFALSDYAYGFNGAAVPKNPDLIRMNVSDSLAYRSPTINRSNDHKYTKIRILGAPIVVVTSLFGSGAPKVGETATLIPKWTDELEYDYEHAIGAKDFQTANLDAARMFDRYRNVFQLYGAPTDFGIAAPSLDAYGALAQGDQDYQKSVRSTMRETKLLQGIDYSTDPPTDENPEDAFPDFLPPQIWIKEPYLDIWETSEAAQITVHPLEQDWGVFADTEINHILAANHWAPGAADTGVDPYYDFDNMILTMAVEADQRLQIEWQLYPDDDLEDYSVHELEMPEAQLWVLAPWTVVGVGDDPENGLKAQPLDSGPEWRTLRNDVEQMNYMMAAEISRYFNARALGRIPARLLLPWGKNLGKILTEVEDKGDIEELHAPVTRVEWAFGDNGGTTMYAGYAQ